MKLYNKSWKLNYHGDDPGDASEYVEIIDGRCVICDSNELCDFWNDSSDIGKFMADNGVLMWNDVGGSVIVDGKCILIGDYDELKVGKVLVDEIGGDTGATIAFSLHKATKSILKMIRPSLIINGVPNGKYRPYALDVESPYIRILSP